MDNIIDVSIPVAEVVDKHPEVLEILVELGFKTSSQSFDAQHRWAQSIA